MWNIYVWFITGGVAECKRKWFSIRDHLRRTIHKRRAQSGQKPVRKYKYEDILSFLVPHLGERERISCVSEQDDEEDDDNDSVSGVQGNFLGDNNSHNENAEHIKIEEVHLQKSPTSSSNKFQKSLFNYETFAQSSKPNAKMSLELLRPLQHDFPADQFMELILAQKQTTSKPCEQHPVDAFLYGIAPTLKTLNPRLLNEAKGKIFSIVQEYELIQLEMDASNENL